VVLTRYDSTGTSAGLSARYLGQLNGNKIENGVVTWTWNGNTWSGTWRAGIGNVGVSCPSGQTNCNGTCADTNSDLNNCGYCGNSLPRSLSLDSGCLRKNHINCTRSNELYKVQLGHIGVLLNWIIITRNL
jgi:hypothetical protein